MDPEGRCPNVGDAAETSQDAAEDTEEADAGEDSEDELVSITGSTTPDSEDGMDVASTSSQERVEEEVARFVDNLKRQLNAGLPRPILRKDYQKNSKELCQN